MKVGIIEVGQWHNELYYNPLKNMSGVELIGVSDRVSKVAEQFGKILGCPAYHHYEDLIDRGRPDMVIALGRHHHSRTVAHV